LSAVPSPLELRRARLASGRRRASPVSGRPRLGAPGLRVTSAGPPGKARGSRRPALASSTSQAEGLLLGELLRELVIALQPIDRELSALHGGTHRAPWLLLVAAITEAASFG